MFDKLRWTVNQGTVWRRGIALVLAFALLLGCNVTPFAAYAVDIETEATVETAPETLPQETVVTEPTEAAVPTETVTETTGETFPEETVPEEAAEETVPEITLPEETEQTLPEETAETVPMETEVTVPQEAVIVSQDNPELLALMPETVVDGGDIPDSTLQWKVTVTEEGAYTLYITGEGPMPKYTDSTKDYAPFRMLGTNKFKLVFGEGVTKVDEYTFRGMAVTSIQFSSTITSIAYRAFGNCTSLTSVTIPGNITTISSNAFENCTALTSVTLEEGVTTIGGSAFSNSGLLGNIHLPSTLTSLGNSPFTKNESYSVSPDNPSFTVVDGILYSKDMTALIDYPKYRVAEEYVIPSTVTTLKGQCLRYIAATDRIVIPATVKKADQGNFLYNSSGVKELYVEDRALPDLYYGQLNAANLTSLRLPENTGLRIGDTLNACGSLEHLTIPNGTYSIAAISQYSTLTKLKTILYDAANSAFTNSSIFKAGTSFDLTIGPHVENLQSNFSYLTAFAEHIYFTPNTRFTIAEGAFASLGDALTTASGTAWVDEQGCVYLYDTVNLTAKLAYCPPGLTAVTVPGSISIPNETDPENPTVCTVTGVCSFALARAEDLTAITFEAPESIRTLENYALAYCPTLTSVNGQTSVTEALESFPSLTEIGLDVLVNTGLEGSVDKDSVSLTGVQSLLYSYGSTDMSLSVGSSGETTTWVSSGEDETVGAYHLLTGDSIVFTAVAENKEGSSGKSYCRIYLRLSNTTGSLSITPGETYTFDNRSATCYATEDPLTVYLEFELLPGDTISTPVNVVYPTPDSPGGSVTVWGVVLSETDAENSSGKVVEATSGTLQAYWDTQREEFAISKTNIWDRNIQGDTTTQEVVLNGDISWYIDCLRESDEAASYGQDPVDYIDYTDTITLPEGFTLKDELLEALNNGMEITWSGGSAYLNGVNVIAVGAQSYAGSSVSNLSIKGLSYSYDAQARTITTTWRLKNISTTSAQIPSFRGRITLPRASLKIDSDAYLAALKDTATPTKTVVTNTVDVTLHYRHSGNDVQQAVSQDCDVTMANGTVTLTKDIAQTPTYFGEDLTWYLHFQNPNGTTYTYSTKEEQKGDYTLYDPIPSTVYIKPENMERMFQAETGRYLTITISDATLAPWEPVTDIYGDTAYRTGGNSDLSTAVEDQTLTICLDEAGTGYLVRVEETGAEYQDASLAAALQAAGYAVTTWAQYTCRWRANPGSDIFQLNAGERHDYYIYATVKDTFTLLTGTDWMTTYAPSASMSISNTAKLLSPTMAETSSGIVKVSKNITVSETEAEIDKHGWRVGGEDSENFYGSDGDHMRYILEFYHHGDGSYENLPIVDDIYGSQYLLVSKEKNPHLAGLGLPERGDCYLLTEGSYTDVVVGTDENGADCIAATITVQIHTTEQLVDMANTAYTYTGLHTQIKWYFAELSDTGAFYKTITYDTLVETGLSSDGSEYSIGNIVFANDKKGYRIYEGVWGDFIKLDLQKTIVDTRGETPDEDVLMEEGYSTVYEGDQVTYRLMLRNISDVNIQMTGEKIADALPSNAKVFQWEKGVNVTIEAAPESVDNIEGLDDWYLADSYGSFGVKEGQQYIRWPETTTFHFTEAEYLYLYVTLTYPDNEGEEKLWDAYGTALKGGAVSNKLYIYQQSSSVSHYLGEPGEVLLQKGVYANTYRIASYHNYLYAIPDRSTYRNTDSSERQVVYYATVYNGADKRLYLNDLVDDLPDGFSYLFMCSNPDLAKNSAVDKHKAYITTVGGLSSDSTQRFVTAYGSDVTYRSAKITAQYTDGTLTFHFGEGTGDYAVKYDSVVGKYYLDEGEAIVFGYACTVGGFADTDDTATNTISMAYLDYTGTGVELCESTQFQAANTDVLTDQNDGDRQKLTAEEAALKGIPTSEAYETYLSSDVSVRRGGIQPGIEKSVVSYTSANGNPVAYKNSVGPYDTIQWSIRVTNDGSSPMYKYTITDTMPYPYLFTGSVGLKVVNSDGVVRANNTTLFTIPEHDHTATKLYINSGNRKYGQLYNIGNYLSLQMDWVEIDGKTCERLTLQPYGNGWAVPEGGYIELTFQSSNPTGEFENTVYTNRATVTPDESQPFTQVSQGSILRDEAGDPESVMASAPINVSFGYATGADKRVTQKNTVNTAVSTDEKNYIYLPNSESTFTYSLTVHNDSGEAMDKLVLIDNLPEVGDHSPFDKDAPRESEFKVSLAKEPNFTVTITPEEGEAQVLDPSEYTVQYQTGTVFTDADWEGAQEGTSWTTDPTGARSIRVMILDDNASDGERIPEDVSITVSFDAVIDGSAEEEQTAWNSFGYHYGLRNIPAELEAMPMAVGVKIGTEPTLQKELRTYWGEEWKAEQDTTFRFLVYTGEAVTAASKEELLKVLQEEGRQYREYTTIVPAGKSQSEPVSMAADGWTWVYGQRYSITELSDSDEYAFDSFNTQTAQTYTFTYDPGTPLNILCRNLMMRWEIDLTKVGEVSQPLAGAVFAIYSPNSDDQIPQNDFEALEYEAELQFTDDDGTWYLKEVRTSDTDGKISFTGLLEERYKLVEIRAPEGYINTHRSGVLVSRTEDSTGGAASITLLNKPILEMPETGSSGFYLLILLGNLPILAGLFLLYRRKRNAL